MRASGRGTRGDGVGDLDGIERAGEGGEAGAELVGCAGRAEDVDGDGGGEGGKEISVDGGDDGGGVGEVMDDELVQGAVAVGEESTGRGGVG